MYEIVRSGEEITRVVVRTTRIGDGECITRVTTRAGEVTTRTGEVKIRAPAYTRFGIVYDEYIG